MTVADERTWATLGHVGGILLSVVAGLVVWLMFKDRSQYLREQAREALNFQITVVVAAVALLVGSTFVAVVTFGLGSFLLPLAYLPLLAQLVFGILAGVAASRHEDYRYPFALRLVR